MTVVLIVLVLIVLALAGFALLGGGVALEQSGAKEDDDHTSMFGDVRSIADGPKLGGLKVYTRRSWGFW